MRKAWNGAPQNGRAGECIGYFKEHPVFARLFEGFCEKYASYGAFSGTVTLTCLTEEELEDLEGFFRSNYHGKKSVSISAVRFGRALADSRFSEIAPKELLEWYFGERMSGKKEQKREDELARGAVFGEVQEEYAGTPATGWLLWLREEPWADAPYFLKRIREAGKDMEKLRNFLRLGADIINALPVRAGRVEYLAVFAAGITGNPHAFDGNAKDGQLLYQLVQWVLGGKSPAKKADLFPALQRQRQYLAVGILMDDISNYAMLFGVRAGKKGGGLHAGMEGFLAEGEMIHVPLSVIAGWQWAKCVGGELYIVENPSVYAMLAGKWKGQRALMCMNGQPRLSSILLLDLLAKTGTKVYYAGDFDPEGILIAQKLRQYYKGEFSYWHMSVAEYKKSISREAISEKRLRMLEKITDPELAGLAEAIACEKLAGYQENIWMDLK